MSEDDAIRATNDDAASCKRSAVHLGYWKDPYITYFIRASERRAPEINRGYYARVQGTHTLLKQFLQLTKCECQIISLGAGFDTTFWNLRDEGLCPRLYVEVDFEGVTSRKTYYIQHRKPLVDKLAEEDGDVKLNKTDLHSKHYHIVAADLRNLVELEQKLSTCGIQKDVPTLFVAECVLVYMPAVSSSQLLKWIVEQFKSTVFINYEMINIGDRFGQIMVENIKTRGCGLPGAEHCQSLESQKQRYLSTGWTHADSMDMLSVYRALPQADVHRIEKLEFLDELELFNQLLDHYAITWAFIDSSNIGFESLTF